MKDFTLNSVLNDLLNDDLFRTSEQDIRDVRLNYNVYKKDKEDMYVFPVVGLNKKDISATIDENYRLTVDGKGKDAYTGTTYNVNYSVNLSKGIYDLKSIHSVLENGLLYISIPKTLTSSATIKIM